MAKLIGKNPPAETVYTLELTERELGTMLAGIGATAHSDRKRSAEYNNVTILARDEAHGLYDFLRQTLGVKH